MTVVVIVVVVVGQGNRWPLVRNQLHGTGANGVFHTFRRQRHDQLLQSLAAHVTLSSLGGHDEQLELVELFAGQLVLASSIECLKYGFGKSWY